jgi:arylsulfatase A-like enzyme
MTGRHPNRFGCFKWGYTLRPQEITIAELLKGAGYRTGHFGKWHLGSVEKGSPVNPGESGFDSWFSAPNFFDNDPILSAEGKAVKTEGESSLVTADAAIEFIRKSVSDQMPFFAVVWFGSPHLPHIALAEDRQLYSDQEVGLQHFYGEITAMDRAIGRLRETLTDLKVKQNTVFWYCSDNGALPGVGSSGGFRGNKGLVYEGGLLVPAVLEWPDKYPRHQVITTRGNTSDILPTLLEIAGVDYPSNRPLDGISLIDIVERKIEDRPSPMGFWDYPTTGIATPSLAWMEELWEFQNSMGKPPHPWKLRMDAGRVSRKYPLTRFPGHSAWLDGDWKLHRISDNWGDEVRYELYNLANDPYETNDVSSSETERVKSMLPILENWLRSVVRSLNGEDY